MWMIVRTNDQYQNIARWWQLAPSIGVKARWWPFAPTIGASSALVVQSVHWLFTGDSFGHVKTAIDRWRNRIPLNVDLTFD